MKNLLYIGDFNLDLLKMSFDDVCKKREYKQENDEILSFDCFDSMP